MVQVSSMFVYVVRWGALLVCWGFCVSAVSVAGHEPNYADYDDNEITQDREEGEYHVAMVPLVVLASPSPSFFLVLPGWPEKDDGDYYTGLISICLAVFSFVCSYNNRLTFPFCM